MRIGEYFGRFKGFKGDTESLDYLNPKSMENNGLYGYYYGFRAIILHTFGVQV